MCTSEIVCKKQVSINKQDVKNTLYTEIMKCISNGHFAIPQGQGRAVIIVIGKGVGYKTMPTCQYVTIVFMLQMHIV